MLHQTIKEQIKDALRNKDTIRLDTLRGLNALALNEILAAKVPSATKVAGEEFISDDKMLALIKRSVKQRKDSIEQFTKGNREDLASKERAELRILEAFMPTMMSRAEIKVIANMRVETMKAQGSFDPKSIGKLTGMIMKELAGKADGADVKAVIDEILKA
jgi:uncharacterized protein YqeY